ncbi:MAG: sulfurtransferase TusA family protein [Alphaproteobacteria bacterium]
MANNEKNDVISGHEKREDIDYFLDITTEVCPLTFVKTKLLIERMSSGQTAEVRLGAGEPLENVPRAIEDDGHLVLSLEPEAESQSVYRLRLRKL